MKCFIIAADRGDSRVRSLAKIVESLGYTLSYATGIDVLRSERSFTDARRPLVLVPDLGSGALAEPALRLAQDEQGRAFVVYVAETLAPDLYKALVRSQAGEWIGWGTCAQELRELTKAMAGAETPERTAKVVSFLPSKGGVGNTTLALESGIHLSTRRKRPVRLALLDLNLQGGTLADALDIEPRFEVGEIIAQPERLDEQLIDVFTSRHTPRLDVFAAPHRRIALGDVRPEIVFTFIDAIAKRYEAVLIDLPHAWVAWIDNILQGSDAVVLSGGATVPALRGLTQTLAHLDGLAIPASKLAVAVNACETDLLGRVTRRTEIERPLAGRSLFCIRRDASAADGALDAGRSLLEMSPNARVSADIRRLAEWCGTAASLA
ncbi:CpaE family protein [uncultured Methylobacterium sp.]|uniref:AAA family ATPase n=1 Tax=uncultured Methylobacterium sp. TaxID=157278 RepID=UPI0035C9FDF8